MTRTRGQLLAAVSEVDPDGNPWLQRRDVTGDGKPETFCNVFIRLVLERLGIRIPALLVNDMLPWFEGQADVECDWRPVSATEAAIRAEEGFPTVGLWANPKGHGHAVLVVPAIGGTGMHAAQAGARNWANEPIEHAGLPANAYQFFTHE